MNDDCNIHSRSMSNQPLAIICAARPNREERYWVCMCIDLTSAVNSVRIRTYPADTLSSNLQQISLSIARGTDGFWYRSSHFRNQCAVEQQYGLEVVMLAVWTSLRPLYFSPQRISLKLLCSSSALRVCSDLEREEIQDHWFSRSGETQWFWFAKLSDAFKMRSMVGRQL